uniref:(northern house mosquito) hypothetical protein n=1 Tax=Culex pipiens TaxID=7175 RepID=A0A8D8D2Q8_CULPI
MKPTECWTWALSLKSEKSYPRFVRIARFLCGPPLGLRKFANWRKNSCETTSKSTSVRSTWPRTRTFCRSSSVARSTRKNRVCLSCSQRLVNRAITKRLFSLKQSGRSIKLLE